MHPSVIKIVNGFVIHGKELLNDITNATGIRGLRIFLDKRVHRVEKLALICIVICAACGAYLAAMTQFERYKARPTVISLDRNYRSWNGTLPAITLCYYEPMDSHKADEYLKEKWNISIENEEYFYFLEFLYSVLNATVNNFEDLASYAEDKRFERVDLFQVVRFIVRPFDQEVSSFDTDTKVHLQSVMTESGMCYTLNSPMSDILKDRNVKIGEINKPISCQYNREQCFIKLQIVNSAARIEVHSPFEVAGNSDNIIELQKSSEILATYKVTETVASENLRELSTLQRKCVFLDEGTFNLPIYSKSLCLKKCRALMALEMCNCVPFFYPFVEGPSCTPAGFECLQEFKWPLWVDHICKCPITCTEQTFSVHYIKRSSWTEELDAELKSTSTFRWHLIPPKVRVRRDILFSFEDLIVSFGGVTALFLGISFWNVCNIIFVICKRFFYVLSKIYLKICK